MTHILIEIFPSLRNAKSLQKIVARKPSFTDLIDVIKLYIDSNKTQVLVENKELGRQLEDYIFSKSSINKLKMDSIYYLLRLYPEYRIVNFVQLYIDLLPTVQYPIAYKSLAKYKIMVDELQKAYIDKTLSDNRNLDFRDFQRVCGFTLNESQIAQYIEAYFGESRRHNLRFKEISEFLEICSLARKDKRIITEYLYLRTLEMDRMKLNKSEIPKFLNNKKEESQSDFNDLILLGVASTTISSVLSNINLNISNDNSSFGNGGSFSGGGASSTY